MKQFLTVIQGKNFLSSLSLTLLGIWLIGPYLTIAGKAPFSHLDHRLIASFVALIFFYILEYHRSGKLFLNNSIPDEIKHELQSLKQTLNHVMHALHSNSIKSFLFKYRKPWFLVLGPTHSGKSTLLNKADLNIKGLDNLPPTTITPTKFFSWWLADDAVFIDIGGRYLRDNKDTPIHQDLLFQGFFKLLKRFRPYKPINGLILAVNLQELTVNTKEQSQLKKLQQILNDLILQFINFPIYLVITRCDTIDGFAEYFEDLGPEERNQLFGLSFPLSGPGQSLPQLFNDEYNSLLTRLNERVIWRLHKEHNLDKIGKIKNFPLQMEFLKNPLAKLLNLIFPHTHINLRGIFFTSAFQKDTTFDNLTKTLARAYDIHHIHQAHRTTPSKNYFIKEIFQRIIYPEAKFFASNNKDNKVHFLTSVMIILITLTCVFLFFNSYRYNLETLKHTQQIIHDLSNQPVNSIDPLMNKLNSLHSIISQLSERKGPWYTQFGTQQAKKLQKKAESIYTQLLTTQFLAYLQRSIEIQLQNTEEDTNQVYATLKVYLMLGDHRHLDKKFFIAWFDNYWHQLSDENVKPQLLSQHLTALLSQKFKERPLNTQLIENKRIMLNNMPQSRLVLTILQNQYQRSPVKIDQGVQTKVFNNLPTEVPGIYNIINFRNVYYTEITKTCQEITNGNWVLGKKPQAAFSDITLNQLSTEVKAIYLNEYGVIWSDILNKIKMENIQNLIDIIPLLELLNNPQSALIQLINTVKNNTQPISDSVEFTQQVSSRFISLNNLSSDLLKNTNQTSLFALKQYLEKIVHATDIDRASYEAAKGRMENQNGNDPITAVLQQARMLPEPLQTWHTTIAAESWRLILRHTQNHLNRIWVATVYPQYQTILDKRYPLFKESTVDIALNDFANFFGYGGTMDLFFKNYLQPFVDSSRLYWEWKNVDGQRINIPQTTLEMFIRAALIQKMFFPEDSRVPAITFSLVPVDLDASVQRFMLDLEGQQVIFQKDNEQIISLTWPGPQPNHTEVTVTDDQSKKTVITESGPWSWFKILDKAHLEATTSPKHFKLTFNFNGGAVHYELYTNGVVNPFIPGILNAFRCPENL